MLNICAKLMKTGFTFQEITMSIMNKPTNKQTNEATNKHTRSQYLLLEVITNF